MKNEKYPLVSIGVPVFNGEIGLSTGLDSLLKQDYPNLEIIISDNASSDLTPFICENYVMRDSRVKYYRSEQNLGAIFNFIRVFKLSSGKYFMWAAHDDWREPSFVSACVDKMEQCPEAVLCQSHSAIFIEGREEMLCVNSLNSFEGVTGLVQRYRETLKNFPATAVYGLYRSSAMQKTRLYEKVIGTDVAFIQELSIHGEFVQVPKVLFNYFGRERWNTIHQDYRHFFEKDRKPWWYFPFIILFSNHFKRVTFSEIPFTAKLSLWWVLLSYEAGRVILKFWIKVFGLICPAVWKKDFGLIIYSRWMHSPNIQITSSNLFFERIIQPRLGWWM